MNNISIKSLLGVFIFTKILSTASYSQKFEQNLEKNYEVLKSKGKMPGYFISSSTEKYLKGLEEIKSQKSKRSEKKSKQKFVLKSTFLIDDLLQSGRIIYNDDVSVYVEKIAKKVLKHMPDIKNEVQVLVVKSSNVNAFTTQGGLVFVTLGLIAQLENEAQLAYILSHEFIHFKNNHVIESHLENTRIETGRKGYKSLNNFDKLLAKSNFSKDTEYEADKEGFKVFTKTGYSISSVRNVFDVLEYSYLPFDDIEFDTTFFNTKNIKIPAGYYLNKTNLISSEDNYDDQFSSHPNIKSRRVEINKLIKRVESKGKKYLVSEEKFKDARDYARFELCEIYIQSNAYSRAIYSAYLLKKKYPNNEFLNKIIIKSLYSLAKYKEYHKEVLTSVDYEQVQGSSQQLYHLFSKLEAKEIMVLATLSAWELYLDDSNSFNKQQAEACLRSLVADFKYTTTDFFTKSKEEVIKIKEETLEGGGNEEEKSKYDKIKEQKVQSSIDGEMDFMNFALVDLFKNEEFSNTFEEIENRYFEKKKEKERSKTKQELKAKRKEEKKIKRDGLALGIDKIILLDPYYLIRDNRKKESIQYVNTEAKQADFKDKLVKSAKIANLNLEIIDPSSFNEDDTNKYNDLSVLNDWVREWSDINRFAEGNDFLNPNTEFTQKLVEKYNTEYFLWTGIQSARELRRYTGYYILLSALYPVLLPVSIAYAFVPKYNTHFYNVLFNVKTGEAVLVDSIRVKGKDRQDIVNSRIYDTFNQIKTKR